MMIQEQMGVRGVVCFIVLILLPLALALRGDEGLISSPVLNEDMVIFRYLYMCFRIILYMVILLVSSIA